MVVRRVDFFICLLKFEFIRRFCRGLVMYYLGGFDSILFFSGYVFGIVYGGNGG